MPKTVTGGWDPIYGWLGGDNSVDPQAVIADWMRARGSGYGQNAPTGAPPGRPDFGAGGFTPPTPSGYGGMPPSAWGQPDQSVPGGPPLPPAAGGPAMGPGPWPNPNAAPQGAPGYLGNTSAIPKPAGPLAANPAVNPNAPAANAQPASAAAPPAQGDPRFGLLDRWNVSGVRGGGPSITALNLGGLFNRGNPNVPAPNAQPVQGPMARGKGTLNLPASYNIPGSGYRITPQGDVVGTLWGQSGGGNPY